MASNQLSADVRAECTQIAQKAIADFLANITTSDPTTGVLYDHIYNQLMAPLRTSLSAFFLVINATFVFFMIIGFTFLEAGMVRSKNMTNALWKYSLCYFSSAIGFWLVGFSISFGDTVNGGVGNRHWALGNKPLVPSNYYYDEAAKTELNSMWFFEYIFCATAVTIMAGAVGERMQPLGFFLYTILASTITYPFVAHWAWNSNGFLKAGHVYDIDGVPTKIGYVDFAGSGVVHVFGATTSLAALVFLGPRIGRFRPDGRVVDFPPNNIAYVTLGFLALFTGFFSFNAGSQLTVANIVDGVPDGRYIGTAAMGTTLCAAGGFITAAIVTRIAWKKWQLMPALTGACAGCVAACHSCAFLHAWGAFTIGCFAAFFFLAASWAVKKMRIDDTVDAVASHFGGGFAGILGFSFLAENQGILYAWDRKSGLFLAWQIAGFAVIVGWAFTTHAFLFLLLKMFGLLRLDDPEMELAGLDYACGHEICQPSDAWEEPCVNGGRGIITTDKYITEEERTRLAKIEAATLAAEFDDAYLLKPGWSVPIPTLVNWSRGSVVAEPLSDAQSARRRKPQVGVENGNNKP